MKLCINCEHYRVPLRASLSVEEFGECHHPRFVSMVTGKLQPRTCSIQRDTDLESYCGRTARFFEPVKCDRCDRPAKDGKELCAECEQNRADVDVDGEAFRGGEAAAYSAEQQARIQRDLK